MIRPPYFAQWESRERIAEILSGALPAAQDPLWPRSGARSAEEYATWAEHLCGMACLRMALGQAGRPIPSAFDLARACTERGGYVVQPDGVIRGLIYAPCVAWVGEAFDLRAEVVVDIQAEAIPALLARGTGFMASVHPSIRRPDRDPPSRGGHLVYVFAADGEGVRFHNPSGDTPDSQEDVAMRLEDFARFFSGRGILVG